MYVCVYIYIYIFIIIIIVIIYIYIWLIPEGGFWGLPVAPEETHPPEQGLPEYYSV